MSMKQKSRPRVGDELWEVEWCEGIPLDENGDGDIDRADMHCVMVETEEEAMRIAKEKLPIDAFGSVAVTPMRFEPYDEDDAVRYPHAGFWEAIGDTIHVDE